MGREEEEEEEEEEGNNLANAHIPAKKEEGREVKTESSSQEREQAGLPHCKHESVKKNLNLIFIMPPSFLPIFADMFIIAFSFTKSNVVAPASPPSPPLAQTDEGLEF